jgi:WD40 repeat protein
MSLPHPHEVFDMIISPDSKRVVTGSLDGIVRVWNAETKACLLELKGHRNLVTSVAFSPDGRLIASGSDDDSVRVWNVETGERVVAFDFVHRLSLLGFSADGKFIMTSVRNSHGTVMLWDVATWKNTFTVSFPGRGSVVDAKLAPNNKFLVMRSTNDEVCIVDLE